MVKADMEDLIQSKADLASDQASKNEQTWLKNIQLISDLRRKIEMGGGPKNIYRQHAKNRLTARERIKKLIDPITSFDELGTFVAYGMYEEWGGAPSAGTVTGLGYIENRLCMIIANDATVKAGAFFPMTASAMASSRWSRLTSLR